ncbi:radical SAM protein [Marinigracilibium pacificum]|uniref:Radical SAM protein n=1 Tax=Marinigracilibium pacificum TaxID=2729599 RepID=A0A848J023_9BACT|nr:radical SAM protein [Marinigracilibium pacificum]NMM48875.1 radical SAM protein [Marinigracilibium pacificum]
MKKDFERIESLYWVFTQLCNDKCDHCYNNSGPHGSRISEEECLQIIDNLPAKIERLILSGGEPLAEKKKLYLILDKINEKYGNSTQVMLQTNGDLLNKEILETLIEKGVSRFDIASIDRYHKNQGNRLMELADIFESCGVNGDDKDPLIDKENYLKKEQVTWGYWGATEDMWLGGNWARGRAMEKDIWKRDPEHNFCSVLSGGIGFLNGGEDIPQEISIQLWAINPCCPGTIDAMGDARVEKVSNVLRKVAGHPVFEMIDKGDPFRMGESIGVTEDYAKKKCGELGNVCLWCDEFFKNHFDMKTLEKK